MTQNFTGLNKHDPVIQVTTKWERTFFTIQDNSCAGSEEMLFGVTQYENLSNICEILVYKHPQHPLSAASFWCSPSAILGSFLKIVHVHRITFVLVCSVSAVKKKSTHSEAARTRRAARVRQLCAPHQHITAARFDIYIQMQPCSCTYRITRGQENSQSWR